MRFSSISRAFMAFGLPMVSLVLTPRGARAQTVDPALRDAYFQALARHFDVPAEEVEILGDWGLDPDEIPVVLFISEGAGVSPDALIGLRRDGRPWREVARRSGMGNRKFHLGLPADAPLGFLSRAYSEFRGRPPQEWDLIVLEDQEIVYLVNIRVLSEYIGVPPLQVLESREAAGSFVAGFGRLIGRRPLP